MDLSFLPPDRRDSLLASYLRAAQDQRVLPTLGYHDFIGLYQSKDILFFRDIENTETGNIDLLLLYRDGERLRAPVMKQEWLLSNPDYLYHYLAGNKNRTVQLRGRCNEDAHTVEMEWNHFHSVWEKSFLELKGLQACLSQTL